MVAKNTKRDHKHCDDPEEDKGNDHTPPNDDPKDDPNNELDERRKKHWRAWQRLNREKNRTWTPWLLIRYALHDLGLRPMPSGAKHWLSPDIWVESTDALGRAVAGEENFLHARLFNLGKANAVPTRVDFYWADPSIGLGAEHMNLIGTEWVEVDQHTAKDVRCNTPWIPVLVNNGHECLKVNCTNPLLDPITYPFQPKVDRHAGQRNITVIPSSTGKAVKFNVFVNNIMPLSVKTTVFAQVEHLSVTQALKKMLPRHELLSRIAGFGQVPLLTTNELRTRFTQEAGDFNRAQRMADYLGIEHDEAILKSDAGIARVQSHRSSACLHSSWGERTCRVAGKKSSTALATLLSPAQLAEPTSTAQLPQGLILQEAQMEPLEQRSLEVQIKVPAKFVRGEFLVVHLQQWTGEVLAGSYTVLIEAHP